MAKDTYYFPHDYEPTSDPKIQAMIGEYGATGYGLYWRIIEMLHSSETHDLPKKPYLILAIAKQLLSNSEFVLKFINDCVNIFELFSEQNEVIFCERVLRNISKKNEKINIAKANGSKGGLAKAKQNLPTAKQNLPIKLNKSKGNESKKENKSDDLSQNSDFSEIHKTRFKKFQDFLETSANNVSKMKEPFTEVEFEKLLTDYTPQQMEEIILSMHNWKELNKKNASANLTFRNWANKRNLSKKSEIHYEQKPMVM